MDPSRSRRNRFRSWKFPGVTLTEVGAGCGLCLEPAGIGCGLYLEPARIRLKRKKEVEKEGR